MTTIQDLTVTVTNVNEPPSVSGDGDILYAENGTHDVATYSVTDPDADSTHAWTVGGTDAAAFNISESGVLSFTSPPDFETQNSYSITVIATDSGTPALSDTIPVTVTITDLNEAPKFTVGLSMAENNTHVGNVIASDEDSGDSVTELTLSGTDEALFQLAQDGSLSFRSAPDFENPQGGSADDSNSYELTVTATSGTGTRIMIATQNLTVTVTNVNEQPQVSGTDAVDYAENGTGDVATYTVTDPDAGSSHEWTLEGTDEASFSIGEDSGVLSFITSPDFETQPLYEVTVIATDDGTPAKSGSIVVTVTITNANDVPVVTSSPSFSVAENQTSVDTITATDQDSVDSDISYTWSGTDADLFTIATDGALSFISAPDFEITAGRRRNDDSNTYELTVTVTSGTGTRAMTATQAVTVTITDANDVPVVTSSPSFSVAENQTSVGTVSAADQDSVDSDISYTWSGTDADLFTIATDGALSFITAPDFENPQGGANDDSNTYELMVTVTSGTGERERSATQNVTVTVTDVSEQPEVTGDSTIDFAENDSSDVATYTVTDPVADSEHDWTVEGADFAAFTITNTGVLSFMSEPDYEMQPSYEVTVKATDKSDPTRYGMHAVVVTITDENEAPAFTSGASFSLAENQTAVGTVSASDEDSADSVTGYEPLSGTDKDLFTITTDGALSFNSAPDFEAPQGGSNDDSNTYELTVTATSGAGGRETTATQDITVTVTDVNELPQFTSGNSFSMAEKQTAVGTVSASDEDSADSVTYTLSSGTDAGLFTIATDGALSFNSAPDYEDPQGGSANDSNTYALTVTATSGADDRMRTAMQNLTVTVTNVNEEPTVSGQATVEYAENGDDDVANYTVTDPDAGSTHDWTLEGTDATSF